MSMPSTSSAGSSASTEDVASRTSVRSLRGRKVVLVATGAFDPITYAHLRAFERARDYLERTEACRVLEGVLSPCSDHTSRQIVVPAKHRLRMLETALRKSFWLRAGEWQMSKTHATQPIQVLRHYQKEYLHKYGKGVQLVFLCGSDEFERFGRIDASGNCAWPIEQVEELCRDFGLVVIRRGKHDPAHFVYLIDVLRNNQKVIHIVEDETCPTDQSSTRLRRALRRGESIKYCIDDEVIEYITEQSLYHNSSAVERTSINWVSSSDSSYNTIREKTAEKRNGTTIRSPPERRTEKTETVELPSVADRATMEVPSRPEHDLTSPIWKTPPSSLASSKEGSREVSQPRLCPVHGRPITHLANHLDGHSDGVNHSDNATFHPAEPISTEERSKLRETPKYIDQMDLHYQLVNGNGVVRNAAVTATIPNGTHSIAKDKAKPQPLQMPPSEGMKAILSQPQQASNESPVGTLPPPLSELQTAHALESPNYDNVTLEELLVASTSWAEYMNKQCEQLKGKNDVRCAERLARDRESAVPSDPPPSTTDVKKRGWFFGRSRSLKESKPPSMSDEEGFVLVGSNERQQQQSPDVLWRKRSKTNENHGDSNHPNGGCPRHPSSRKEAKIRFAHSTKSESSLVATTTSPATPRDVMSSSLHEARDQNDCVTLRFRRYRLAATPETTV